MEKTLIVIVGPTAIGKTGLAIDVAKHYNSEIISSDSRQFYKEMTIGTAVPSADELEAVPHHFIHNVSIEQDYTVGDFEKEAISFINEYFQIHDVLIMVGGSGLYEKAVTEGLDEFPEVPSNFRDDLELELKEKGLKPLLEELKEKDPSYFDEVDQYNAHRVCRALEVIRYSKRTFSSFRSKNKTSRNFRIIKVGLSAERKEIYDRINSRVDIMVANGLIEEVKSLIPYKNLNALQTVGYREIFKYLDEEIDFESAISEIKKNTRRFAKRQLTWYRKDSSVTWFSINEKDSVIPYLDTQLQKSVEKV